MFNLQEAWGADMHILSTHGHIFVTFFAFLLHFLNKKTFYPFFFGRMEEFFFFTCFGKV